MWYNIGMDSKRLYRSQKNKVFAGVCGGLGDYLGIDPVVIRLLWVLISVFTGFVPGLVVYIIAIFVMPAANTSTSTTSTINE